MGRIRIIVSVLVASMVGWEGKGSQEMDDRQ